jgi:hypothetical protein
MDFSPDKLRKRFAELTKRYEAKAGPRDKIMAERDGKADKLTRAQFVTYDKKITAANKGIYEIEMERAAIARALGGKTS